MRRDSFCYHNDVQLSRTTGKEVFFSFGVDRKLKEFSLSGNKPDSNEAFTRLDAPMRSHEDHGLYTGGIVLGGNCESLYTYSADGYLVVRSATEAEPVLKVLAHDPFYHGVLSFAAARDCRLMVTVGGDGIIRVWEWTYSPLGLKEANQTTADALAELDINAAHIREQRQQLARAQVC